MTKAWRSACGDTRSEIPHLGGDGKPGGKPPRRRLIHPGAAGGGEQRPRRPAAQVAPQRADHRAGQHRYPLRPALTLKDQHLMPSLDSPVAVVW